MNSLFKIHDTVLKVSFEAQTIIPGIPTVRSEKKLLAELALCILSSQEKYEVALAMMKEMRKHDTLRVPMNRREFRSIKSEVKQTVKKPVAFKLNNQKYERRLRFGEKKANYISDTIENIYLNGLCIKDILNQGDNIHDTRKLIMKYSTGLGPKQASMFLRNIGYHADFAILDKHIIEFMFLMGLTNMREARFSNISVYQELEMKLKSYAESFNVSLFHLDLGIWTTMRTLKQYQG